MAPLAPASSEQASFEVVLPSLQVTALEDQYILVVASSEAVASSEVAPSAIASSLGLVPLLTIA